jgi:ABC-2 type transport system permease protein
MLSLPPISGAPGVAASCTILARRAVLRQVRVPRQLIATTAQAALSLILLRYVFGGVVGSVQFDGADYARSSYVDFLVPGYVVGAALFSVIPAAVGVAHDIEQGFSDRLRSLPVPRVALLASRSLADTVLLTWSLTVATTVGFVIGFRIHGGVPAALAALGLCILFGFAFTWVFISVGLLARGVQAAVSMAMLAVPMLAISSAFVPVDTLPGWMQPVAENQPLTPMINAVRSLVLGDPAYAGLEHATAYWVLLSVGWCLGLLAVFVPLANVLYRRS